MCGIAGAIDPRGVIRGDVERQLTCLEHRGPDSSGMFVRPHAVIGQTRLAVIDLVNGDPPFTDENDTLGAVFNGEIYNHQTIAAQLQQDGHSFVSRCDGEVIAHLAEEVGPADLANCLDGMFAFAVWDDRRARLVLGRDRTGKKPLYYWSQGSQVVFGSEIKAVLAHPDVPRQLDAEVIPAYLATGYAPTPRTFFAGIRSVPPGYVLIAENGGPPRLEPYWQPQVPRPGSVATLDLTLDEAAVEARVLLRRAVKNRLEADVPLGAFLSGGVDSGAVVALMSELTTRPVRSFTIGFEDGTFDERRYARMVADRFGTEHVEFVVTPDAVDLVERLVWHHDQPFGDSSAVPTYLLAELTRGHVTVALSGDGGDEVFAGYERFAAALALDRYRRLPEKARAVVEAATRKLPGGSPRSRMAGLHRFVAGTNRETVDAYLEWLSPVAAPWRAALLGEKAAEDGLAEHHAVWAGSEGAGLLDRLLDLNLRTYLLDDLLPKVDRTSMAHALEVRSPFLDRDLLEWALRLPDRLRIRGPVLKRVLKKALAADLPREVLRRRKRGFGVPVDRWFRTDLRQYVEGMLGSPEARVRSRLDGAAVDRLLGEHREGVANHGPALWTLLTLEVFLRREGW